MILQHNLAASNALLQHSKNLKLQASSSEKLSTGYKINRAADNAAGTTISEGMRAQIRGLSQASTNVQDGISLVQTADGGLAEIQSMIQRMRELSVQAANDVNTDADRAIIQTEINELSSGITQAAHQTDFNTIYPLLGGAAITSVVPDSDYASVVDKYTFTSGGQNGFFMYIPGMTDYAGAIGGYGNNGIAAVRFTKPNGTQSIARYPASGTWGTASATYSVNADGSVATWEYKDTAFNINFKIDVSCEIVEKQDKTTMKGGQFFDVSYKLTNLSTAELEYDFYMHMDPINGPISGKPKVNGKEESNSVGVTGDKDFEIVCSPGSYGAYTNCDVTTILTGPDIKNPPDAVYVGQMQNEGHADNTALGSNMDMLEGIMKGKDPTYAMGDFHTASGWMNRTLGKGESLDTNMLFGLTYPLVPAAGGGTTIGKDSAWIQAGANENQGFFIPFCDATAKGLGVDSLDVSSHNSAGTSIAKLDAANAMVNEFRSSFGANQNRLEHAKQGNDNTAENLQAAESKIRDTDISKEMVNYSKYNILGQAIQSVLAQSNANPENVLKLLKND